MHRGVVLNFLFNFSPRLDVACYNNSVASGKWSNASEPGNELEVSTFSCDQLPPELFPIIFAMAKSDLPSLALVNRQWREIADSKELHGEMFPQSAFGKKDWNVYFSEMDAGNEPFLPRCVYGDFEEGDLLTFIPKILKMKDEEGNITNKPLTLALMGELAKNSRSEYQTSYTSGSWQPVINDPRTSGSSHWVLLKGKAVGKSKCFRDQKKLVKEQGKGASISALIDTVVSISLKFIKTGECCILKDHVDDLFYLRLRDKFETMRLICGFGPAGLVVRIYFDDDDDSTGVAVARKSIGA